MSLQAIRYALLVRLDEVPGVGLLHDRERFASNEEQFRELYLYQPEAGEAITEPHIRGWFLRRVATEEFAHDIGPDSVQVHTWQLRGYMTFNDALGTELHFDALIEAMRDVIREDPTLGGVCEAGPLDGSAAAGLQVADAGPVLFAGVLCHSAVLTLKTWSY